MTASTTRRNAARLHTLRGYDVQQTETAREFDDLAGLAAEICGAPIGLVSLVEETRQVFIGVHGLHLRSTPIEQSICVQVMFDAGTTVIEDTRADPRTDANPLCVSGPRPLLFYAGAPLKAPNGQPLGTLCVLDERPRQLSESQRRHLEILADQVMAQLNLRRTLRRAEILRREVDHRVKNSLQSVASLARLQARRVHSDEAREVLDVVGRRIATVAALNSELYKTSRSERVELAPFLSTVTDLIRESAPDGVTVSLGVDPVSVGAGAAGALAIVVNEFATNAFKHAFPDDRPGTVTITARQVAPGEMVLTCADDGVGMPRDAPPSEGLGMTIIRSAIEQLEGEERSPTPVAGHAIEIAFSL
ncbi:GAF domain-containing protein [Rhodobacteraceae bacterium CCMM004]|nr:GAF domain-containing protein [Rhodobacteraceae bacterium CCMM004]